MYIKYRDLKRADEHAYLQNLAKINWNDIKSLHNINDMWNKFKNNLFAVIDKHYPIRENRITADSEKWINDSILSEMRQCDYLHRKDIKSKNETDWHFYRAARNGVLKQINEAKREFIDEAISSAHSKPKDMWSLLKHLPSKTSQSTTSYLEVDGVHLNEPCHIANALNDFFCGIGHKFASNFDNSLPGVKHLLPEDSFTIPDIQVDFVVREIMSMSNSKSTGFDNICNIFENKYTCTCHC